MRAEEETMITVRPDGRKGIVMTSRTYDVLSLFILTLLDSEEDHTLNSILEKAQQKHADSIENIAWCTLQIKLDLEARGLIKVISPVYQKRLFFIKLTRQGVKKLRLEKLLFN
jgi:hypothetical protein